MNEEFRHLFLTGGGALVFGVAVTIPLLLLNVRLAPKLGLIDWPKARGMSEKHVPIVGYSLAIFALVLLCILNWIHNGSPWLALTSGLMGIMGHFDDRRPIPALDKLFFQSVCIATLIFLDPHIHEAITAQYGVYGAIGAGLFMLGLLNAVNFIDGIDGLGGIVILCGAVGYALLAMRGGDPYSYSMFALAIVGMVIPFLYLNVGKHGGFLGNVGSYFFSFLLIGMHLSLPINSYSIVTNLSLTSLCFLIPLADFAVVISTRLYTGRSPFQADKGHLHHRLIQSSLSLWWVLSSFALIEFSSVLVAFLVSRHQVYTDGYLPAYVCAGYLSITSVLIMMIEKASRRRIQDYFERLNVGSPIFFLKYRLEQADGSALPWLKMRRIEAKISAEIRVSDVCFAEFPNHLFITLKTLREPVRGISSRLEAVFQNERVGKVTIEEQGEYVKVAGKASPLRKIG